MFIFVCLQLGRDLLKSCGHGDVQVGQNDVSLQAESHNFLTTGEGIRTKTPRCQLSKTSPESSCVERTALQLIYPVSLFYFASYGISILIWSMLILGFQTGSTHPENSHQTAVPEHR